MRYRCFIFLWLIFLEDILSIFFLGKKIVFTKKKKKEIFKEIPAVTYICNSSIKYFLYYRKIYTKSSLGKLSIEYIQAVIQFPFQLLEKFLFCIKLFKIFK